MEELLLTKDSQASDKDRVVSEAVRWPRHLIAILVYIIFTIILTWPLATELKQAVPGNTEIDGDQNIWNLWWFKTALLDRHTNPFYTNLLYYPYWNKGLPLVFHNLQPLNGLLALPVTAWGGPLMAFNFITFFAFSATAFNTYLLALHFLKKWSAALLVGALFAFAPFHLGYFHISNMETMSLEWVPLYVLCLHLWTGDPAKALAPPKYRYLFLAALFLVANALTDWYFTLYMLMYTALWAVWQLVRLRQEWKTILQRFVLLGLAMLVLISPLLWLLWQALRSGQEFVLAKGIQEEITWSAAPWSFLVPGKVETVTPPQWGLYFFGYMALALAGCALIWRRKGHGWWWLLVGLFLVLAMGPYLRFTDSSRTTVTTGIPLPYYLLRNLPLVSISRIVGRFYVVANLALVLMAGYGFIKLSEWLANLKFALSFKPRRVELLLLSLLLCGWILEVQTWPAVLYRPQPSAFYTSYLQSTSDHRPLLELPIPKNNEYSHTRMMTQVYTDRPIVMGYLSRPLVDHYRTDASPFRLVLSPNEEMTAPASGKLNFIQASQQLSLSELLSYYNFGYVVLYHAEFPGDELLPATVKAYQSVLDPPIYVDDMVTAFKVPDQPGLLKAPHLFCVDCDTNWYPAEKAPDGKVFRWAENLEVFLGILAPQSKPGQLSFQAWSFEPEREVIVLVNGVEKARLHLTPAPTPFKLDLNLQEGENSLEFKTLTPGSSPGIATDKRLLSFAISGLAVAS